MLGLVGKRPWEAFCNRAVEVFDPDRVIAHVGVPDKMPAHHPLILNVSAEGIAHPAVNAGKCHAAVNRGEQAGALLLAERAHGPARRNHVVAFQTFKIREHIK